MALASAVAAGQNSSVLAADPSRFNPLSASVLAMNSSLTNLGRRIEDLAAQQARQHSELLARIDESEKRRHLRRRRPAGESQSPPGSLHVRRSHLVGGGEHRRARQPSSQPPPSQPGPGHGAVADELAPLSTHDQKSRPCNFDSIRTATESSPSEPSVPVTAAATGARIALPGLIPPFGRATPAAPAIGGSTAAPTPVAANSPDLSA
mmetsp:Transcript_40684/g.107564  ORF Transcript_40684/g.107564 Transcript_40684/m.107564 type:complete len:207 (+) Transcript_40684:62-682(+)